MIQKVASAIVSPETSLEVLSALEVDSLMKLSNSDAYQLFKRCALAALNTDSTIDDTQEVLKIFKDFNIKFIRQAQGIKLRVENAPASAFVDDQMIRGIRKQLFSVLRDVLYVTNQLKNSPRFSFDSSEHITDAVFHILRNADIFKTGHQEPLCVCWGGHSIDRDEYEFTKEVGYELGLREVNIITGCGPGAMKGPMKGATIGHAKQQFNNQRYIGITEPGIIAAESPNPIVNELVIMPDIEKRLEAFVRTGHGIVVFPGGVGTAEEILYLLGILLHPENCSTPFPLVFAAPEKSRHYFATIDQFIGDTLGEKAQSLYEIIIGDPAKIAKKIASGTQNVFKYRAKHKDAPYFNWRLHIDYELQQPFLPTHGNMSSLKLHKNQAPHSLAADLRKAFSGIVAGNVKEDGINSIRKNGPFKIFGDSEIMAPLDNLLRTFVAQKRMKIDSKDYQPCYTVNTTA